MMELFLEISNSCIISQKHCVQRQNSDSRMEGFESDYITAVDTGKLWKVWKRKWGWKNHAILAMFAHKF